MAMAVASPVQAPASLYVGDLHPDITDGKLYEVFSGLENLASVRVCRDSLTGRSLGYGYVNFISAHDANLAIERLNYTPVNGKVIRIMWSHRDAEGRRSGIGNLFVKNINSSINNVGLHEMFSKFGNILSCKVAMTPDGKSKGYGFVQFDLAESADAAIKSLNGSIIDGKQLYVGNFVKGTDRVSSLNAKYTNLYMKNLDQDITEELLKERFGEFGRITTLFLSKDENGNSRGFGFVNFENPDDAKRALEKMNGTQLGAKVLYVARAQKKAEREQILRRQFEERRREQIQKYKGSNVYVKNIDDDVGDDELREHFSQCGTITSVKLMRDDKGISKGFGFVCFSTPEAANKAVSILHGYMIRRKPLYVAIAQRKEDRQAQLQVHFAQRMAGLGGPSAAVIPAGYPPLYYAPPPSVVSPLPPRQGLMYQPLGVRPGWRPNGFVPPTRPFQHLPLPIVPNSTRQNRQNRGRMNGHVLPQGGGQSVPFIPQSVNAQKDPNNQQRGGQSKHASNEQSREVNNGSAVSSAAAKAVGSASQGLEMLSSMLAAASPQQQKQILGERLYPLVAELKSDIAAKITGMLLEMDNSELLLLLDSPEALAAKVDEAVKVLKLSKTTNKVADQEGIHSSFLSAEVAVS